MFSYAYSWNSRKEGNLFVSDIMRLKNSVLRHIYC